MIAAQNQLGGRRVEEVVIFGDGQHHSTLKSLLEKELQLTVRLIDPFKLGPINFATPQSFAGITFVGAMKYYYLLLLVMLALIVINVRIQNSRIGRAWEAIREDEVAARAMGIYTTHMKLLAFAMGATFGGVAGGMFSAMQGFISPESFVLVESVMVVSM